MKIRKFFFIGLLSFLSLFADPLPYCLSFNGIDNYVRIENTIGGGGAYTLRMQGRFTIELWFSVDTYTDGAALINNGYENNGIYAGYGIFTADTNRLLIRIGNGITEQSVRLDSIPTSTWHHLAVTYNRYKRDDNLLVYLNGNLLERSDCFLNITYPASGAASALFLGRSHHTDEARFFKGMLDDLRIWSVVRTKSEIKNGMHRLPDTLKTNLMAWYPFNDGSGNTLSDESNYRNNGQLINMSDSSWQLSHAHLVTLPCNDIGFRRIALNWSYSPFFTSYSLDLSTDPGFVSSLDGFPRENISTSYYVMDDIEPGIYYYRVKGHFEGEDPALEPWSDIRSVSTVTDAATPIVLSEFTGIFDRDHILISWQTESQVENAFFLLQRSGDGSEWETIERREGAGTTQRSISYRHTDRRISPGKSYVYRLQDISYSGETALSHTITVTVPEDAVSEAIQLGPLYPNPFNPRIAIPLSLMQRERIDLRIIALDGRCIELICNDILESGTHIFFWEPRELPSGLYLIRLHTSEYSKIERILYLK